MPKKPDRVRAAIDEASLPQTSEADALLGSAEAFIAKILSALGSGGWDISAVFCGDILITELNKRWRNIDEPTDILSFPLGEKSGELYLSLETVAQNAKEYGVSCDEELRRLLIHGVLHIAGMDHATNDDAEPMLLRQEALLKELGGSIIIK